MKIYIVKGEHFAVPGVPSNAYAALPAAATQALELVNIIRKDVGLPPAEDGWEAALVEAQRKRIADSSDEETLDEIETEGAEALAEAAECDVWIEDYDVTDAPAMPAALETLIDRATRVANLLESIVSNGSIGPNMNVYPEALAELESVLQLARFAAVTAPADQPTAGCDDPELVREPVRVVIGINGGAVQWALANGPGARVQIVDFDVEGHGDFDLTLVTDKDGDEAAANVYEEDVEIDPLYFARLDTAPRHVNGLGGFYGDEEEDQEEDEAKWLVTAELHGPGVISEAIGIGPDGGFWTYSGYMPGESSLEALEAARQIIDRRFPDGTRVVSLLAHRPAREPS